MMIFARKLILCWSLTFIATFLVKKALSQGSYIGCFKEDHTARVFASSAGTYDPNNLNPTVCMTQCERWMYRYAGLTEGRFCFCSSRLPTVPVSPESFCDETCSGPSGKCGGFNYVSAYEVDVALSGLSLSVFGLDSPVVEVDTRVYFNLSRVDGLSSVVYAVDFGDGSGLTPYNDSLMLQRSFATPGEYIVTAHANNTASTKASIAVSVQAPVNHLQFYCPPEAAYMEEMRCNATVLAGTYLNLTISYGDGVVETFAIADPYYFTAGPGIPHWGVAPPSTSPDVVYLMPNSEFGSDGIVLSFEFYATTAGSIKFLILSPSCSSGSYCYNTNQCGPTACTAGQTTCDASKNLFCPQSKACVAAASASTTTTCQIGTSRYSGSVQYQIVREIPHTFSSTGQQTYHLDPTINPVTVSKGYIIGYTASTPSTARIATRGLWPNETSDLQAGTCTPVPCTPSGPPTNIGARHLVRATASKPTSVLFFHTYTNTERFPVLLEVKNDLLPSAPHAFANQSVLVAIGINVSIVIAPEFAATNDTVQILLAPHTGSNVTYLWTTGDGSELNTTTPYINYTYRRRGCFSINNTAYNAISRKSSNATMICVEDKLTNLTVANNISDASQTTIFWFSMVTGSDYICDWTLGDGATDRTDMITTPITGSIWSHSYANDGEYQVNVTCWNNISFQTTAFTQYVEWPITNLRLLKNGTLAGSPFTITYLIDKGTTPTFNFSLAGVAYAAPYDPTTKTGTTVQLGALPLGIYKVVVQGWNHISFVTLVVNFTAQLKIVNPRSSCNLVETVSDALVTYTASVDDGSDVNITWNFADGTSNLNYLQPPAQSAARGLSEVRKHGFPRGGEFVVQVTICNDVDIYVFNHPIIVYGKIENLTLVDSGPVPFIKGQGKVNFTFESLYPPANVSVVFDYGNGQKSPSFRFDLNLIYPYTYLAEGTYQVVANVSHKMAWGVVATTVIVAVPVINMILVPEPGKPHASLNVPFLMGVAMDSGEDVTLVFDFGDGSPTITKQRISQNPYQADNETHTYTAEGWYTISVTALNAIGNTTMTYLVVIQRPVLPFFTLVSDSPRLFPPGLVHYTLNYPSSEPLPTNATMQFFWGDGQYSEVMALDFTTPPYVFNIPYTYLSDGNFIAHVVISNLASNMTFQVADPLNAGVFAPITSLSMTAMYYPELPDESPLQPGFGDTHLTFPLDRDIVFSAEVTGTVSMYQVLVTDMNGNVIMAINETSNPFNLSCLRNMTANGQYKVQIVAWNPLSSKNYDFIINVNRTVSGGSLTVNPTSGPSSTVFNYEASFADVGSDTCVVLDFGDGTKAAYGNNKLYCAQVTSVPVAGALVNPLIITHKYTASKTFTASMSAYDPMSNMSTEIKVVVSGLDCSLPVIDILNKKPQFDDPLLWNRAEQLDVIGLTDINCPASLANNKSWSVDLVNEVTGEPLQRLTNISTLQSSYSSLLSVPARFLAYGVYRFTYRVAINATIFVSEMETYIRIRPSPIVALLAVNGMSFITRGFGDNITISPQSYSYDPDLGMNMNQTFDKFIWYCREIDEFFPKYPNGTLLPSSPLSVVYTEAQVATLTGPTKGGCFRQGPGAVDFSGGSLTFSTKNMRVNDTYVFRVTVIKDTRVSTGELQVDLVDGRPPAVEIGCLDPLLCTPLTQKVRINPTNRVSVYAKCTEFCEERMIYQWTIYRLGLNGAWLPLDNFDQYASGVNGTASRELAIDNRLFIDGFHLYKNLLDYRIGVTVSAPGGNSISGSSYMELHLNPAPAEGSCLATPSTGMASVNMYSISCQGWTDPDGIDVYQFYGVWPDEPSTAAQLGFSYDGQLGPIILPQGSPNNNSNLLLYVRIFDKLGAVTTYNISVVQVLPISEKVAKDLVNQLLNNKTTSNIFESLIAGGNLARMNPTFLAIADALNAATAFENQQYGNGSLTYPTPLLLANEQYQILRNEKAALRGKMIEALANATLTDIGSIQLIASTLNKVTQETSQINRVNQETAVSKIDEMVEKMTKITDSTPLEEFVLATKSIAATIGNLFQSINCAIDDGTLADIEQAKSTPFYFYDADWESSRKGFMGLSASDMEKGFQGETNSLAQKDSASGTVGRLSDTLDELGNLLLEKLVPGEKPLNISTALLDIFLQKDEPSKIAGQPITAGGATVAFPDWCDIVPINVNCSDQTPIAVKLSVTPRNIFNYFKDATKVSPASSIVTIDINGPSGKEMKISGARRPFEIDIPRSNMPVPKPTMEASYMSTKDDQSSLFYHKFNVTDNGSSLHVVIHPERPGVQFLVFVRFEKFPKMNGTKRGWDFMQNLPLSMSNLSEYTEQGADPYVVFLDNNVIQDRLGVWYIGLRQLEPSEYDLYNANNTPPPPPKMTGRFTTNYTLLIYTSGCYYHRPEDTAWSYDGCVVSPRTTVSHTVCLCNHLTSFGGGFAVRPNVIDFDFVLSHSDFLSNPTIYVTEIIIAVAYILLFIWARRQDKKDLIKLGVTALPDNDPRDRYLYEITVSTGLRKNAGTESKVHIILSGDYDETDARTLEDDQRKVLTRGSTDSFLLAVPRPLGPLNYARIWHDNTGKGKYASWYLNWMIVRDVHTDQRFYFIVNQWLAVEEDDGQISRLVPVCGREQMVETGHLFSRRTNKGFGDDHIWFSVVARPVTSRFTRIQRLSCCLCLLFTAMLANAMFYGVVGSSSQGGFSIGPFIITPEQIYVGIISNLIVFPVNFIIAFLFKKSRPRRKRPSRIAEALKKMLTRQKTEDANAYIRRREAALPSLPKSAWEAKPYEDPEKRDNRDWSDRPHTARSVDLEEATTSPTARLTEPPPKKKKRLSLPWWCVIIGWILLWVTVGLCTAFITFYAIMFQDEKCRKWITSMLISFVTSVFLTQPIKVILLALFFAIIFKKPESEEEEDDLEDEERVQLDNDELWLHQYNTGPRRQRYLQYEPPDPLMLERAREKRLKELKMYSILREIIVYIFFLWIVIVISYDFRDPRAQQVKANLQTMFVDGGRGSNATANTSLDLIKSMEDFWGWMENTFIPGQRADEWYNGYRPIGLRGYLNDYVSRIMGFATMRQLRVKRARCKVPSQMSRLIHECNVPYSSDNEDHDDYNVGWVPRTPGDSSTVLPEYHYKQAEELDSYPFLTKHNLYSGGGYVAELRGDRHALFDKVASLKDGGWVDRYTRAVFLEFSIYNVQANLFACVTMVAELLESSGFDCYYYVEPMNLIGDTSSAAMFTRACQIIYLGFIVFFIIREARNIWKQRLGYFAQFWNWVELWIIALSIGSVVIFVYRYFMTDKLLKIFSKSGGNAYMKFQGVAYWNELMLYMIGLLVFWATMKFIKLLRFNKVMGLLGSTLRYASKSLVSFTLIFAILFFAFVQCFYLIYMASLETFSNVIFTAEECLQMMVGKFNFGEIVQASPILGTFMFFIYMIVVFFILLTMFVTIINEAFAAVRDDIHKQSNEHEMVEFVIGRFKQWTGINSLIAGFGRGNGKKEPLNNTKELNNDPKVIEAQINNLPERLDRFLDCISQVYFQHDNFDSIITEHNASGKNFMKDNNLKAGMYGKAGGVKGQVVVNRNLFSHAPETPASDRHMPNVCGQ